MPQGGQLLGQSGESAAVVLASGGRSVEGVVSGERAAEKVAAGNVASELVDGQVAAEDDAAVNVGGVLAVRLVLSWHLERDSQDRLRRRMDAE